MVAKPGASVAQVATHRPIEVELKQKDLEYARKLNQDAKEAAAKEKSAKEAAKLK